MIGEAELRGGQARAGRAVLASTVIEVAPVKVGSIRTDYRRGVDAAGSRLVVRRTAGVQRDGGVDDQVAQRAARRHRVERALAAVDQARRALQRRGAAMPPTCGAAADVPKNGVAKRRRR